MQHQFDCDNCGKTVVTYCFDNRDVCRFYYTPPLARMTEDGTLVPTDYALEKGVGSRLLLSAITTTTFLCIECVEQ